MNSQRALISLVISILSVSFCPRAFAELPAANSNARSTAPSSSPNSSAMATTGPTQPPAAAKHDTGPPSLFDEGKAARPIETASLDVRINVPHAEHPLDVFIVHPYPVRPPKIVKPLTPLPEDPKALKEMLLQSGYINRDSGMKPYTAFGKRWLYAYREGLRKSGAGEPHGIFTMYQWEKQVRPFVGRECLMWNQIEAERTRRYERATAEYEAHHTDLESDAVRQGLNATEMRKRGFGWAVADIPTGSWWLTCTRKVPGLTYYWQVPLSAAPGENIKVVLSQSNALVITGGW